MLESEKTPQLRNTPPSDCPVKVFGALSLLMIHRGGPSTMREVPPWAGGPRLCEKVNGEPCRTPPTVGWACPHQSIVDAYILQVTSFTWWGFMYDLASRDVRQCREGSNQWQVETPTFLCWIYTSLVFFLNGIWFAFIDPAYCILKSHALYTGLCSKWNEPVSSSSSLAWSVSVCLPLM